MGADHVKREVAPLKFLDEKWAGDAEDFGSLLGGELGVDGHEGDGVSLAHFVEELDKEQGGSAREFDGFRGLAGDICVYYTLMDALKERFKACFIEDATRSLDKAAYEAAKAKMIKEGATVLPSNAL